MLGNLIVPTLRRGNAVVDAPASRNAGVLQTEFPRRSVGTIRNDCFSSCPSCLRGEFFNFF